MTELDRLRAAYQSVPDPDAAAVAEARERLRREIGGVARPARSWWPRLRLIAAVGVAAAVAITLIVAGWPASGSPETGGLAPAPASAARQCSGSGPAARCAVALGELAFSDEVLASDRVLYRKDLLTDRIVYISRSGRSQLRPDPQGFAVAGMRATELWVAPDRSGRLAYGATVSRLLPSPADRAGWERNGRPDLNRLLSTDGEENRFPTARFTASSAAEVLLGGGELRNALPKTGDPLRELSTRPQALDRQIRKLAWFQRVRLSGDEPCEPDLRDCNPAVRQNINSLYGTNITQLLRYPLASPALRRALLTILGRIPGSVRIGTLRDPVGRRAAALRIPGDANNGVNIVLFDLVTGRLIADGIAEDGTARTLRFSNVYDVVLAAVDRVGARP